MGARSLCAVGIFALAVCASAVAPPKFDVVTVKHYKDDNAGPRNSVSYGPDGIRFDGVTLAFIIGEAYNVPVGP